MKLNIYKITNEEYQEYIDWVCATSEDEAKELYLQYTGNNYTIKVTELTEKDLNDNYFVDLDEPEPEGEYNHETDKYEYPDDYDETDYSDGYKIDESFAEYIAKQKISHYICDNQGYE